MSVEPVPGTSIPFDRPLTPGERTCVRCLTAGLWVFALSMVALLATWAVQPYWF